MGVADCRKFVEFVLDNNMNEREFALYMPDEDVSTMVCAELAGRGFFVSHDPHRSIVTIRRGVAPEARALP
jgi:hypothetical protein